jgi:hypothetical protein
MTMITMRIQLSTQTSSMPRIWKATASTIIAGTTIVGMMEVRESCEIAADTSSEVVPGVAWSGEGLSRCVIPRPSRRRRSDERCMPASHCIMY